MQTATLEPTKGVMMSEQQITSIQAQLDALATRRHIERVIDLLGYVLQGLLLAGILWVLTEIVALKTVAAQLSGQIAAAAQISDINRVAALERIERVERHVESVDARLRLVEQRRSAQNER